MRHRPSHRGRNITLAVLAFFLCALGIATWNVVRPLPPVATSERGLSAIPPVATPLAWPASGEAAAEVQGVTHLMTHGEQKAVPIASLAKVITALTVLQEHPQ
jgi:D-alanyl-D-alanine carboxypeptidase